MVLRNFWRPASFSGLEAEGINNSLRRIHRSLREAIVEKTAIRQAQFIKAAITKRDGDLVSLDFLSHLSNH